MEKGGKGQTRTRAALPIFFLRNQELASVLVKQMSGSCKTGLKLENSKQQAEICCN